MTRIGRGMSSTRTAAGPRVGGAAAWLLAGLGSWLTMTAASAQNPRAWMGGPDVRRPPVRVAAADPPPDAEPAAAPEPGAAIRDATAAGPLIPTHSLLATIRSGGALMIPLFGCSFALAVFGIERAVSLRTGRVVPTPFVRRFLERLQARDLSRAQALEACEAGDSPVARAFAAAVRRWGRPAVEIEQAAIDACERELNHLRRYRQVFSGVATVGPLLGLLGTVFGLIQAFNDVAGAGAMGRPDLLARGFGEALVTTAMGLLVAIPAMVLHWYFTGRVDRLAMRLDEGCQRVIDEISQEALAEPKRRAG